MLNTNQWDFPRINNRIFPVAELINKTFTV